MIGIDLLGVNPIGDLLALLAAVKMARLSERSTFSNQQQITM
ncbi:hypothetical protein [Bradyrhizobium liaoningense]